MRRQFHQLFGDSKRILTSIFIGLILTAGAAPDSIPLEWQPKYDEGVELYRNQAFDKAFKIFRDMTFGVPESSEIHYYYAITLAQIGKIKEARKAYEDVIKLGPNSEAAALAKEGLSLLPQTDALDKPPKLVKQAPMETPAYNHFEKPQIPDASSYVQSQAIPAQMQPMQKQAPAQPQQAATNPFGMDPQAMQMMLLMSSLGGNGGGGFNPYMMSMMQNMNRNPNDPNANNPTTAMPPDVMKTMIMNQMMQNMDPFGSNKDDDD